MKQLENDVACERTNYAYWSQTRSAILKHEPTVKKRMASHILATPDGQNPDNLGNPFIATHVFDHPNPEGRMQANYCSRRMGEYVEAAQRENKFTITPGDIGSQIACLQQLYQAESPGFSGVDLTTSQVLAATERQCLSMIQAGQTHKQTYRSMLMVQHLLEGALRAHGDQIHPRGQFSFVTYHPSWEMSRSA